MARVENHASPDSLLGQLQRGRGEGYLRILSAPKLEAQALLLECLSNDPRLDSQVESRAGYYASIAIAVGLDLTPVARHLRDNDDPNQTGWNTPLTVETLGELAKRGYRNATGILCDYIGWGQWWDWSLDDLVAVRDAALHQKIASGIERRFPSDDELENALSWFDLNAEPWLNIIKYSPRIRKVADNPRARVGVSAARKRDSAAPTIFTTAQILELANDQNRHDLRNAIADVVTPADIDLLKRNVSIEKPFVADVALAGLEKLAPDEIFSWIRAFWSICPEKPRFLRLRAGEVLVALSPDLTLPLARQNLFQEDWDERLLAEKLLEAHATSADIPILHRAIQEALADDAEHCYRLCSLVGAFAHLSGVGPIQELADVFIQFRYSYGRAIVAKAMHVTAPDHFREHFAVECLWDCEERTRELGVKTAPLEHMAARKRIQELASSEWEEEGVRTEAGKRLA